nr:amino acid ABC transporter permease [Catenulispora acidiphila]
MSTTASPAPPGSPEPGVRQPSTRHLQRQAYRQRKNRRDRMIAIGCTAGFAAVVGVLVVTSPGWPRFRESFLSWSVFRSSMPDILRGFWLNIQIFMVAEPIILILGLGVALIRTTKSPGLLPFRLTATLYADVFRGVPTLLLILVVGFGIPALQLSGTPKDPVVLGVVALTLSYVAYVSEVFRAGLDSVHPSQRAAATALGLSERQTLRFVVLPQAIRNVVPPLLNDFSALQKDTALVSTLGVVESLRQAQIHESLTFNYTPYVGAALLFIAVTVPLARYTDRLARRAAARQQAGGAR